MRNLFGGGPTAGSTRDKDNDRSSRHSSGWKEMLKNLQRRESLRVLDIGPTSSGNINFITGMGHSIYMSNLVEEAAHPDWLKQDAAGETRFDVDGFLEANLNFSGRVFDVVLLWDASDYLPELLLVPLMRRLYEVLAAEGMMLAFFHAKASGGSLSPAPVETSFRRYTLTAEETVKHHRAGDFPLVTMYNNRQIESLLKDFSNFRFFLAKDNLREVIASK